MKQNPAKWYVVVNRLTRKPEIVVKSAISRTAHAFATGPMAYEKAQAYANSLRR